MEMKIYSCVNNEYESMIELKDKKQKINETFDTNR